MIVLDASVLIAFMFDQDAHHEAAGALLTRVAHDSLGVSPLTLAEVLVVPARLGRLPSAEQMLRDLAVNEIPLPRDAAAVLAQLRVDSGLKLPDCCVLLAAQTTGSALATFDDRLASIAAARGLATLTS